MLQSLHIENMAVIRNADVDFSAGLNCLTGETGSGKTLIVGSLNFLLGGKVTKDIIRNGEKRALVSALFSDLPDGIIEVADQLGIACEDRTLLLQKTIEASGRTTTRINGASVTQGMHRELAQKLLSIHGQNDNLHLMQKSNQLQSLDAYACNSQLLSEYVSAYDALKNLQSRRDALSHDEAEAIRLREMLTYQIQDIDKIKPVKGEEERAESELSRLHNAEKIRKQLSFAYYLLKGSDKAAATLTVDKAGESLNRIAGLVPEIEGLSKRLEDLREELEDIADAVDAKTPSDEDVTDQIDRLEGRLDTISKLKKKYGSTVEEILEFRNTAEQRLNDIENADEEIEKLDKQIKCQTELCERSAKALSESRQKAAHEATESILHELTFLDMPNVQFEIKMSHMNHFTAYGWDDIEFWISPNKGEKMSPLSETASGGELARVMLALRCVLNERQNVDVSVYDEVDTGISGKTARKVGLKLADISKSGQVICVTHSAQIASLADAHFKVEKAEHEGRIETQVSLLNEEERVNELARILGGLEVTESQRAAARDMILEGRG